MAATRLGVFGVPWHDLSANPVVRIVNETASVAEGYPSVKGIYRVITEATQIAEGVLRFLSTVVSTTQLATKLGVYGVPVAALTQTAPIIREATESMQISEALLRNKGVLKVLTETLDIAEAIYRAISGDIVKVVTESVSVLEGLVRAIYAFYTTAIRFTVRIRKAVAFRVRFNERED